MSENPENQPSDDADDPLRHWEEALESHADPFDALAQVLGGTGSDRNRLFRLTGTVLLGCTLEHMLGSGGGGVTYSGKAKDGSRVAVKLVMAQTLSSVERFEQECRLLQSLEHPAIVRYRAHAVQDDGTGVLVMDLVDGTDLESLLAQVQDPRRVEVAAQRNAAVALLVHKLDLARMRERGESVIGNDGYRRRMLRFLATVAEGLHHAHERGVVHRDVKPMNVLVDSDFAPVLIDFGLARDLKKLVSLTQSGIAIGTLAYMAPEQIDGSGGVVDRRVDVYSLGLLLFRAMTGHDLRQVPDDVWRSRRRPFLLDPDASRELPLPVQAILYTCLDPRPERRYPDAKRLAADLRAAAGDGDVVARIPSWIARQCRDARNLAAMITGLLSAIATILWMQWPRGREVEFVANCDVHVATVFVDDREEVLLEVPVWLPVGAHSARIVSDQVAAVERSFVVDPGEGTVRIPLVTHRTTSRGETSPNAVPIVLSTGHSSRQIAPGLPRDRRFVDGAEVGVGAVGGSRDVVRVEPDLHLVRAVDGKGRVEEQQIVVGTGAVDVQLLPTCLAEVDGAFRRTWSTVLSPLPDGLSVGGDAQVWIGRPRAPVHSSELEPVDCALVPAVAGTEVEAVLRVDFPVAMRSAVLHASHELRKGGSLAIEVHVDGEAPRAWPAIAEGHSSSRLAIAAPRGARWIELRARLRTHRIGRTAARLFFGEHMGLHWGAQGTAFAIVADEGGAAVLPTRPPDLPIDRVPVWPSEVVHRFDGRDSAAPAVLRHRDGAIDVLVSEFARTPEVGSGASRGSVRRFSWPDWKEKSVIEATCMHPREKASDGLLFGAGLLATDDRDDDGWSDFLVVDPSSDRTTHDQQLTIARFCSSSRDPQWVWPQRGFGPVSGTVLREWPVDVGDWDGDGAHDFTLRGQITAPPPIPNSWLTIVGGVEGIGVFDLETRSRTGSIGGLDALPGARGPRPILFWETESGGGERRDLQVLHGGRAGIRAGPIEATSGCHAMLLPSPRDAGVPDVVVLRLVPAQDDFTGFERYRASGIHLELVDRLRLSLPFRPVRTRGAAPRRSPDSPPPQDRGSLVRTGDLDGDGVEDFAVPELAVVERLGVLFVSGAELRILARAPLPRADSALGTYVPSTATSPAALLVALRTGSGVEFHSIPLK